MFKSVLVALIVVQSVFPSDIKLSLDSDFGIVPISRNVAYNSPDEYKCSTYRDVLFLTLTPKADFKFVYSSLSVSCFSLKTSTDHTFKPFRTVFDFEVGLYKNFSSRNISLIYLHRCSHQIVTINPGNEDHDLFDNAYDKLFLRFSFSN